MEKYVLPGWVVDDFYGGNFLETVVGGGWISSFMTFIFSSLQAGVLREGQSRAFILLTMRIVLAFRV